MYRTTKNSRSNSMPTKAQERFSKKKEPKKVLLEKDFAGIKKGQWMFVGTPQIVADYIKRIPFGETRTIERMRRELARRRKCDASCPVSTAIFIRVAAQAAIDDIEDGVAPAATTPFWRLINSEDKIAKKLTIDSAWIDNQREIEAVSSA